MGPKNEPHRKKGATRSEANPTSSAEETIARDLGSPNATDVLQACEIILSAKKRHLDEAALQKYATAPLTIAAATHENREVRFAASEALYTLSPELGRGARNLVRVVEQGLSKRRATSYSSSESSAESSLPYAEQLIVVARWVTEAVYHARAYPENPVRKENGALAHLLLNESFGGKKIYDSADSLSTLRANLPRDLRDAQEGLDSLAALKIIPLRVHLSTRPSSETESLALNQERQRERVNYLLRSLANENSYDHATLIVLELGRIGDERSIQALRQAAMGLVSQGGGVLSFRNEAQRLDFQRACRLAERMIANRISEQ